MRKALSGNIVRELRVRRMKGKDTRWLRGVSSETCASLASL